MNRSRAFAEGVVIMVCPVLLAIALNKVDLKSKEQGRAVPIAMLMVAAVTLVTGICPFLVCCFSKCRGFSNGSSSSPHTVTKLLAPLSSMCLVALACWIIRLILSDNRAYPAMGIVFGLCIFARTVSYFCARNAQPSNTTASGEYCSKLENSLDFSAGVAALLFIGLEGLALEGQINSDKGIQHHLTKPMGASFFACLVGVCLMLVETIPPLTNHSLISNLTGIFDIITTFAVCLVMLFIMLSFMKLRALILLTTPFLILMMHAFHVAIGENNRSSNSSDSNTTPAETSITMPNEGNTQATDIATGSNSDRVEEYGVAISVVGSIKRREEYKPASLEVTKATFTGFLAVSIPSISSGSVNKSTECFMHLAAAAIVSGLTWRLLTHVQSENIRKTANVASFVTHLCVVIASVPFTLMAVNALS
ncbi:hypothetical protein ACP70R_037620 [Stipagrostis hirtigluma subsp. patula]